MIHGGAPAGWLEFSADLNPLGTPAAVAAAVADASYRTYADLGTKTVEEHLARDAAVAPDSVLITAGATEAIRLVARAFGATRRSVTIGPTYSEYERACALAGSPVREVRAAPPSFDPPLEDALEALGAGTLMFLCDPNSPTGRALEPTQLLVLASRVPDGALLVIDQSFAPFAPPTVDAAELIACGRVVLIRSLTKRLAAPGIRVGYVVAPPDLVRALRTLQDPWSVSAHALAAARVATWEMTDAERSLVAAWRERLQGALRDIGAGVVPAVANFVLADLGGGAGNAVEELAARRIAVRDCASFGLAGYLRSAVRPPEEQDILIAALTSRSASRASRP
jgi:threonine-phosphate decarboxylase